MGRDENGQVAVMVVGLALVCLTVVGVTVDGTRAFLHRRTLQNAADYAALAAASELDLDSLYGRGNLVRLAAAAAEKRVDRSLRDRGLSADAAVEASARTVSVLLRDAVPTSFLRLLGIRKLPVAAEAVARPMP